MPLTLCVLLTAVPGNERALVEYEDQVLVLLARHGARLLQRVRNVDAATAPYEVHIMEFPSEAAFGKYMDDPARLALADLRDLAIASTQLLRVEDVTG
jgi:uncharacterized protein (DUF1330 family)